MSVNLSINNSLNFPKSSSYKSGNVQYWHTSFNSKIDNIEPGNSQSRAASKELQSKLAALSDDERKISVTILQVYQGPDYTTPLQLIVYGPILDAATSMYTTALLKLSSTLTVIPIVTVHLSAKILPLQPDVNKMPSADINQLRSALSLPVDTSLFTTEYTATNGLNLYGYAHSAFSLSKFSLTFSMSEKDTAAYLIKSSLMIDPVFNKKILSERESTDLTIVAGDGTEFKCHKCFLEVQSNVFKTMLAKGGSTRESQTSRIQLDDISKDGLQALLDYIYAFDIKAAKEDCGIALELLEAGHKYNINTLEDAMIAVILAWDADMLEIKSSLEISLRLFTFTRNVDGLEDLKQRSFEVLRKRNAELLGSEYCKELFTKDSAAAMELFALAMKI